MFLSKRGIKQNMKDGSMKFKHLKQKLRIVSIGNEQGGSRSYSNNFN